jgi:hypothetical protein
MTIRASDQPVTLVDSVSGQTVTTSIAELDELAFAMSEQNILSNTSPSMLSKSYEAVENSLSVAAEWTGDLLSDGVEGATGLAKSAGSAIGEAYSGSALEYGVDSTREWGSELATEVEAGVVEKIQQAKVELQEWKDDPKAKLEETASNAGQSIESAKEAIGEGISKTKDGVVYHYNELFGNKGIEFSGSSSANPKDSKNGDANCDCQTIEPCCVHSGKIADGDQETRFVKWPVCKGDDTNLLLVTKDIKGFEPGAGIKIELKGKNNTNCEKKYDYHPSLLETPIGDDAEYIVEEKSERTLYFNKDNEFIFWSSILCDPAIVGAYLVISTAWDLYNGNHLANRNSYKIIQCTTNETVSKELGVVPIPYLLLSGSIKLEPVIEITASGMDTTDRRTWTTGSINGQYCDAQFSRERTFVKGQVRDEDDGADDNAPFVIWLIDKIYECMRTLATLVGGRSPGSDDSYGMFKVEIKPYLGMSTTGLELKKVGGKPDLLLEMGNVVLSSGVSVKGTLNLVDLVLKLVSGGSSTIMLKIKDKIAKAQKASETLEKYSPAEFQFIAELTLDAQSGFSTETGPAAKAFLLSDGSKKVEGLTYERENKIEVRFAATAEVTLRVRAEVYILEAALGVYGSLNTGWNYQWKTTFENGGNQKYKRYFFEGLKLKAGIAFEISGKDYDNTGDGIDNQSQSDAKSGLAETEAYLMKPTVDEVTDNIPAWIKE